MNRASDMFVFQSLAFFRKNLKVDNFFNSIKNKTRQKKNSNIVEKIWFETKPKRVGPYCRSQFSTLFFFLCECTMLFTEILYCYFIKHSLVRRPQNTLEPQF